VLEHDLDLVNLQYQAAAYNMRSPAANLIPWRLRGVVPTAVTFHDLRVPYLFPKAGPLRRRAVNFMARRAHGCIATNAADAAALRGAGITAVTTIPIGSNIHPFPVSAAQIAACRAELGLAEGETLLAYFGFLNESKGAETLLRALAALESSVHLVFIGGRTGSSDTANNAAYLAQLDQLIVDLQLGERVHWTGFVADGAVSTHLQAAQMVVMPYRDGASLRRGTLMAALAHGRPLITTQPQQPTGALEDSENCLLVPADDAAAVAAAVRRLQADPAWASGLGTAAAATAEQFSWEKIAARTADFFDELVSL
jgi:glycosyltransferase involved in cell wall biosynthesis